MSSICKIKECNRVVAGHGWCLMHYKRWWRHGDVLYGTPEYRFWAKVNKKGADDCWEWGGKALGGKGKCYGQFSINNKTVTVHRFSYQLANGAIAPDMHVLHHCDNPICVNPRHLFIGTNKDNIKDKMSKGRWNGGRPKVPPKPCDVCSKVVRYLKKGLCNTCYERQRRN